MSKNKVFVLVSLAAFSFGGFSGAFVFAEQSDAAKTFEDFFGSASAKIIYSENFDGVSRRIVSHGASLISNSSLKEDRNIEDQSFFLSPDHKHIAVEIHYPDAMAYTYILDLSGNVVVFPHAGNFVSWIADSTKALLYLPIESTGNVRKIYYLDTQGNYYDSGLPSGTIGAAVSPLNESVVYALTNSNTDEADVYLRENGTDKLLINGDKNIFVWFQWSPQGDKIAFLKSDLLLSDNKNELWLMNADGSGTEKISNVVWNYPPVWSPDGQKIAFSNAGNIWEFDVIGRSLSRVTSFTDVTVEHPSYSKDGQTIVFMSNASGQRQVWAARDSSVVQLTKSSQEKDYPIVPQII